MNREKFSALLFDPEHRAWVRALDATAVLLGGLSASLLLYLNLPVANESVLLKIGFWGAILSMTVLAHTLYRKSDLFKIERLAILTLVLSSDFALMMALMPKASN